MTGIAKSEQEILWVLRSQSGDREALNELLRSVQEPLYRYIFSLVREQHLVLSMTGDSEQENTTMINGRLRIEHLTDHPEILPVLKEWFETEWESYYGPEGPGDAEVDLLWYSRRSELPVGLVAFLDDELCGIAALKSESIITHSHLGPWAAAGLVSRQYRRRGIGAELLKALEEVARSLGYEQIYCGTGSAATLLERCDWQFMERINYCGDDVSIYWKSL